MKRISQIGKFLFPVIFIVLGLILFFKGLTDEQSTSFIIASISIFLMGLISFLAMMEILKNKIFSIILYVALPIALILVYLSYQSVATQIKFNEEVEYRNKIVIEKLKDIRTAQILFKEANKRYAKTFEELIDFCKNGKLPVIKAIGNVPDTMTEAQAVAKGLVIRDTIFIPAIDTIKRSIRTPLDSLMYIPFSGGEKFLMNASEITQGLTKVPVFEVFAPDVYIYKGLDPQLVYNKNKDAEIKGLKLGDMNKPVITGNWE